MMLPNRCLRNWEWWAVTDEEEQRWMDALEAAERLYGSGAQLCFASCSDKESVEGNRYVACVVIEGSIRSASSRLGAIENLYAFLAEQLRHRSKVENALAEQIENALKVRTAL